MGEAALAREPPPVPEALLSVRDLEAWYGDSHVLHGMAFDVPAGEVVTLLGRNGAGKTTTLKAIMGLVRQAHAAAVTFDGRRASSGRPAHERLRTGAASAYCAGGAAHRRRGSRLRRTFGSESWPRSRGGRRRARIEAIAETLPSASSSACKQEAVTKLSGGEQQMLAIARILRSGARLLLLDEPTEGLAPVIVQQIGRTIERLKREGFTIILVEQNFRFAATLADRHYVVEQGRVIDRFANTELEANIETLHRYLGV